MNACFNTVQGRTAKVKPLAKAVAIVTTLSLSAMTQASVLEEITVTAQKREQNLQDVGIAVSAFTGAQMKELGISRSVDVTAMTPGVHSGGAIAGQNTQFTIRGVTQNDFNDIVESPNATYLDDGYLAIAQAQTFALFDIERVEILKGPQGTLFGRNATGGLIHFISTKPSFDQVEGYIDISYGEFDVPNDANLFTVEAAIGGPITDTFAARLAVKHNDQDPYLQNDFVPGPGAPAVDDLGDDDTQAVRLTLAFLPGENTEITVSGNYATSEMSTGPYQSKPTTAVIGVNGSGNPEVINSIDTPAGSTDWAIVPPGYTGPLADPFTGADFLVDQGGMDFLFGGPGGGRSTPGGDFFGYLDPDGNDFTTSSDFAFKDSNSTDTWGLHLDVQHEFNNGLKLTSITDYKDYEKLLFIDVDAAPINQLANYAAVDASSFTQEFRLNGETDNSRWVAGFYYLNIDNTSDNGLKAHTGSIAQFPAGGGVFLPIDVAAIADLETNSYSIFGQIDYDLSDTLTFTAGLRIMEEKKDVDIQIGILPSYSLNTINVINPSTPGTVGGWYVGPITFSEDDSETLWTGKIQLDWRPTDDTLIYGGINRGVKAGSYNSPLLGAYTLAGGNNSVLPYDEEVLLSYEVGFKTSLNETTRLNGSAYYYDYSDYQAFLFAGVGGVVINADAETYGLELELITSPIEGMDILLSAAYVDATVEDVPLNGTSEFAPRDVSPTFAPEFQATALVRYEWAVGDSSMSVQLDSNYSDEFYYNLRNFDSDKFDSYVITNFRLGWSNPDDTIKLAFEARNITDERAGQIGYGLATLCGCNEESWQPPRYYGFNARYSF